MTNSSISEYLGFRFPFYQKILQEMVEINSFTANGAGVNRLAELTAGYFSDLGFSPEFVPSVNPQFGSHLFLYFLPYPEICDRRPRSFFPDPGFSSGYGLFSGGRKC